MQPLFGLYFQNPNASNFFSSSILMIFGILVDIYERTSEPKYGPAMTSNYGETEAGKSASTRFSAQTPDLQQAITFSFL